MHSNKTGMFNLVKKKEKKECAIQQHIKIKIKWDC